MDLPPHDHRRIDLRSLAMHRAIAGKLLAGDLRPIEIGLRNIERWTPTAGRSTPYLIQWREILSKPPEEIAALIVEDTERMAALRQASPFAGALTPKERWRIYDAYPVGTHLLIERLGNTPHLAAPIRALVRNRMERQFNQL